MPSSGYTAISFTAGEQPTTAKWNLVGSNDASFNTMNGMNDGVIVPRHFAANAVNQTAIDWTATTPGGIWWQELGRTTLGAAGNTISVSFTAKKYLLTLFEAIPSGVINTRFQFNSDTGANYSERSSSNGSADSTGVSAVNIGATATASATFRFGEFFIINIAGQEKVVIGNITETGTAGAGNTTMRATANGKWANTSTQISSVQLINTGAGNMAIGSELIVLGHD